MNPYIDSRFSFSFCKNLQEHVNEIDFDYMEYARQRFEQYWLTKPRLLEASEDK